MKGAEKRRNRRNRVRPSEEEGQTLISL